MPVGRDILPLPMHESGPNHLFSRSRGRGKIGISEFGSRKAWESAAIDTLNLMSGGASFNSEFRPSAGQARAAAHIHEVVSGMGAPDCSPTEAYDAICKARAGYHDEPVHRARYQREQISLPDKGGLVDGATCLTGSALEYWGRWRERILLPPGDPGGKRRVVPYCDPGLLKAPSEYAWVVAELASRGLLQVGERAPSTLGLFLCTRVAASACDSS